MCSIVNYQSLFWASSLSCLRFSLGEIKTATTTFKNYVFEDDFGKVYHGNIYGNSYSREVLVKCMYRWFSHASLVFRKEIVVLTACHHANIISLVGFCEEKDEQILVYEFMPNGSLHDYLYYHKDITPPLTVEQRLGICIGVAKGLSYLHSQKEYNIIYSADLETKSILVDANFVPKISGLRFPRTSDAGPLPSDQIAKGSIEERYAAPEYYEPNCKLSRKADVYAFGAVLLEVLCERPKRLLLYALPFVSKGYLPRFVPEDVEKSISIECSQACANLIRGCLEFHPDKRPCMNEVVHELELALKLQKQHEQDADSEQWSCMCRRWTCLDNNCALIDESVKKSFDNNNFKRICLIKDAAN